MQAFTKLSGPVLVLEQENIDTDQIIPARFLTATDFDGIGDHAFADWRNDADGKPVAGHVLNQSSARHSPILVAGHNFGCGSSREHAPHALMGFGFRYMFGDQWSGFKVHSVTLTSCHLIVEDVKGRLFALDRKTLMPAWHAWRTDLNRPVPTAASSAAP